MYMEVGGWVVNVRRYGEMVWKTCGNEAVRGEGLSQVRSKN